MRERGLVDFRGFAKMAADWPDWCLCACMRMYQKVFAFELQHIFYREDFFFFTNKLTTVVNIACWGQFLRKYKTGLLLFKMSPFYSSIPIYRPLPSSINPFIVFKF